MVGHALTPYCCQTWNSLSLTTGCRISYRLMAWWTLAVFLSDGNLALCTPMTASSSGYFCSSFRNCGSTCMQLIQQYVQKSSSTTLPDRSFRLIAPRLLSHSRPEGKSGASVVPTYDLGCIALTPLWILRRASRGLAMAHACVAVTIAHGSVSRLLVSPASGPLPSERCCPYIPASSVAAHRCRA